MQLKKEKKSLISQFLTMRTKLASLSENLTLKKYKDLDSLASANIAAQKRTVPESMVKEQLPKSAVNIFD